MRQSANDYSTVMEEFTNQVLVTNVLRARDQTPLNFSDLPIIHGSISAQGSASLSIPFGSQNGATTRNTTTGGLQFTSSPTFDTSSLNTEAFTLNLLQPVSPVYIESLWSAGLPKALLLHLFAEWIQLPSAVGEGPIYFNRPGSPDYAKFVGVVNTLIAHDAQLRSFTVLDPIGLPLTLPKAADESIDGSKPDALKFYSAMIGLDPVHFKVGYVSGRETAGFQIYRRFGSQIALCVSPSASPSDAAAPVTIPPGFAGEVDGSFTALSKVLNKGTAASVVLGSGEIRHASGSPSVGSRDPGAPGGPPLPSKASSAQSGTNAAMTQAVQAYRVSGILNSAQCGDEEFVADRLGENDFVRDTRRFGSIRWRSTLDLYHYLGALARDPAYSPTWVDGGRTHTLFQITQGERGDAAGITVTYHSERYSVLGHDPATADSRVAHGLEVMSLLSQLVNIAKISSDIPTTRSFEILP